MSVCNCHRRMCLNSYSLCPLHPAVEVVREKGFHLDVEDYLAGVLIMASELVSLSVNLSDLFNCLSLSLLLLVGKHMNGKTSSWCLENCKVIVILCYRIKFNQLHFMKQKLK